MYRHQDTDEAHVSLHDCRANRVKFEDDVLTFYFPDGIWALEGHAENNLAAAVRTDAAKVKFPLGNGTGSFPN